MPPGAGHEELGVEGCLSGRVLYGQPGRTFPSEPMAVIVSLAESVRFRPKDLGRCYEYGSVLVDLVARRKPGDGDAGAGHPGRIEAVGGPSAVTDACTSRNEEPKQWRRLRHRQGTLDQDVEGVVRNRFR